MTLINSSQELLLPTAQEMQAMDAACIAGGVTGQELMERAGQALYKEVIKICVNKNSKIIILCGPGNNGGDGLVLARLLSSNGYNPQIIIASSTKYSEEFIENFKLLANDSAIYIFGQSMQQSFVTGTALLEADFIKLLSSADFVVDALLGSRQSKAPKGSVCEILEIVAANINVDAKYIAVDIPTGIDCSNGQVFHPHFSAQITICIQFVKSGLVQYPARSFVGELKVVDIGIKPLGGEKIRLLAQESINKIVRSNYAHKGNCGAVVVIGSEAGMPGATVLSAQAALRIGAGLVTRIVPASMTETCSMWPEIMQKKVGTHNSFMPQDVLEVGEYLKQADVVVIGPGLLSSDSTLEFVEQLLLALEIPAVIDAGALQAISLKRIAISNLKLKPNFVLTPHPGEFAKMLDWSSAKVQEDRYLAADHFNDFSQSILVLKGAGTLVANSSATFVSQQGNAAMASAGMGDVLTGVIAGLLAQGLTPVNAAKMGVYLHGLTADRLYKIRKAPIIASDLIAYLPEVMADDFFELQY